MNEPLWAVINLVILLVFFASMVYLNWRSYKRDGIYHEARMEHLDVVRARVDEIARTYAASVTISPLDHNMQRRELRLACDAAKSAVRADVADLTERRTP